MNRIGIGVVAWLLITGGLTWSQTSTPSETLSVQKEREVVKDFEHRVAQYMRMRKKEAGSPPKPTNSSTKLAESEGQMADSIRAARSGAHQGDIFTPQIAQCFRDQIAATLSGPQGSKIRASLKHAEPLSGISLKVNEKYPQGVALQSTPPSLLLNLPILPKELEYRIVGNDLVLHDIAPNIIVDFIPNAVPQS
jgi:hypothetical protein